MLALKNKEGAELARLRETEIDELTRLGFLIATQIPVPNYPLVTLSAGRGPEREWNPNERMQQQDWINKLQDDFGLQVEDQRQMQKL